ncbi:formyltransferase family protein [Helicobacter ibis]|uniref:Formyltransferase family protein n=1 Tax=Helicobacter ibis TaxID=2962633 RepID=A0ABT4VFS2_9HELI|nr:formyltransferase family protein [Helicobacter ibis]MDA3969559.1 formyltransferase family protein [Helicobacter ibis]
MKFDKICIIGSGNLALKTMKLLYEKYKLPKEKIFALSQNEPKLSLFSNFCKKQNINYQNIINKNQLENIFMQIDSKTLVVSANNYFIFTKKILDKHNLTIINYHNSLLPKYKGSNAALWCIYNNEEKSGITWHMVNENIDSGEILVQKEIILNKNHTFLSLTQEQLELGVLTLESILQDLLNEKLKGTPMTGSGSFYYKSQLPNDGLFDSNWDLEHRSRFLRAFDCGKSGLLKPARAIINNKEIEITKYNENFMPQEIQ